MREPLPQRRPSETLTFQSEGMVYEATVGFYEDGRPGEVFLQAGKSGTAVNVATRDSAIALSFALQHGCSVHDIRSSMTRDPDGNAEGPLGCLLDLLCEVERRP